jgi:predicted dehydrogenase
MANKAYIDAIVIASPVYEHYPMITAALNAGLHVHTQPPLGLNVKQAEEVCAKASESKVRTSVFFNSRSYAPHLYLKQLIDAGYVGTPLFGDFQYLTGRNLSLDEGDWRDDKQRSLGIGQLVIHMADLARWWMGSVDSVSASTRTFKPLRSNDDEPFEAAEDSALFSLAFESGAHGSIYASRVASAEIFHHHITIRGDAGALQLHHSIGHGWQILAGKAGDELLHEIQLPNSYVAGIDQNAKPFDQVRDFLVRFHIGDRAFVDSIVDDRDIAPTFEDCLAAHRIVETGFRSAETGRYEYVQSK